jgi:hypothetical protein
MMLEKMGISNYITIRRQTAKAFPQRQPSPPDLVHEPKLYFNTSKMCGTNITVREPPLLLKLQLSSSTAAASSRSSWPVAFLPDDVGLWSWLSCRKCPKPDTLGTLSATELPYGAVW